MLATRGDEIALVWLGGVNYLTGEALDLRGIVDAGHRAGCVVGFDLAHAVGNVELRLHEWDADFAVWCTYKYLNGGPGAVASLFVHQRHGTDPQLVRLAGWWGNDPATRFAMPADFVPVVGRGGLAGIQPADTFAGTAAGVVGTVRRGRYRRLRAKSRALSAHAIEQLSGMASIEVLTPLDPERRGNQISIRVPGGAASLERALRARASWSTYARPTSFALPPRRCTTLRATCGD